MLGEQSGLEVGLSASGGTTNAAARARATVLGLDAKAKLWTSPRAYLLLQAEALRLDREVAGWDPAEGYVRTSVTPAGGYVFADYNFALRMNAGISYERYQEPEPDEPWSQSVGAFAGYSLFEETTVVRLDARRFSPEEGEDAHTLTLRVIYAMGPHKPHQF
jgi:hypothetical protein